MNQRTPGGGDCTVPPAWAVAVAAPSGIRGLAGTCQLVPRAMLCAAQKLRNCQNSPGSRERSERISLDCCSVGGPSTVHFTPGRRFNFIPALTYQALPLR